MGQVQLSDGQVYEFPDDVTPEEVQRFDLGQQTQKARAEQSSTFQGTVEDFIPSIFRTPEQVRDTSDALVQTASAPGGVQTPEGRQRLHEIQTKYRYANLMASTPEARDTLARREQEEMAGLGVQSVMLDPGVNLPKLIEEEQTTLFGKGRLASAAGAAQRALSGVAESFVSPEGQGMFLPGLAGKAFGKAFVAQMVASLPAKIGEAAGAYSGGDNKAGDQALIDAAVTSGMLVVPHFISRGQHPTTLEDAFGKENAQAIRDAVREGQSFRREPTTAGVPFDFQQTPTLEQPKEPNAPIPRIESKSDLIEHKGIQPREDIQPNAQEVRGQEGTSPGDSGGLIESGQKPPTDQGVLAPESKLDLGDGFTAIIDTQTDSVRYENPKGETIGRLETSEGPNGEIMVENHTIADEARGHARGQKAIERLSELTGKIIISDEHPSKAASAMWDRLGATRERITLGQPGFEESQMRYVFRPKQATPPLNEGEKILETTPAPTDPAAKGRTAPAQGEISGETPAAPKVEEPETTTMFDPRAVPIADVPIEQIKQSKDVPNFKEGADPETGVITSQRLEGKFDPFPKRPITVWKRLNGDLEVITGRHRLDLARRSGETTIPAQVVDEAKGYTRDMALTLDAESNILDGQGSVEDYAHYFKNSPNLDEQLARSRGLLSRAKGKAGWSLGRDATDDLYSLWKNGKISEDQAVAISKSAPNDPALQQIGAKQALKGKTPAELISEIQAARILTAGVKADQMDLWGNDDAAIQQMEKMAAIVRGKVREIDEQIAAISGASKRPEVARKLGVNVDNPAEVAAKLQELRLEKLRWEKYAEDPALVKQLKEEASPKPKAVEPPKKAEPPRPEKIVAVAVKNLDTGEITSAPNKIHVQLYKEAGMDPAKFSSKQVAESSGFLTDTGRFVIQEEAGKISGNPEIMGEDVTGKQKPIAKPPELELSKPESVEEAKAREAREKAEADKIKAAEKLKEGAAKPLKGTAGDLGQGDLLNPPEDLFAPPKPEETGQKSREKKHGIYNKPGVLHGPERPQLSAATQPTEKAPKQGERPEEVLSKETHREQAEKLATALEQLKAKDPLKGGISTFGLIPDLWNKAVSVVQAAIRAGGTVADAVEAGLKYIRDNVKGKWDERGARKAFTAISSREPEAEEGPRAYNRQVMGVRQGPLQESESVFQQRDAIRQQLFDGRAEVSDETTAKAWDFARDLAGENRGPNAGIIGAMVRDVTGAESSDMAPALALVELRNYALKLARGGDRSLMQFLVNSRIGVIDTAGKLDPTQVGRTLRGLAESASPFWEAVIRITAEREAAAGRALGVGEPLFHKLMDTVDGLRLKPEEVESKLSDDLKGTVKKKPQPETYEAEMQAGMAEDASTAEKTAKQITHAFELKQGAEWLKPENKNIVREIVKEFLTPKKGEEKALAEESLKNDLIARLTAPEVGVTPETARQLAQTVWNEAYTRFVNRRDRAINRAAETAGPLRPLIDEILNEPYQAQHNPKWRRDVATRWFMGKGLSREQAEVAAKNFSAQFDKALQDAGERAARRLLEGHAELRTIDDVVRAIRLGLTDPSKHWADDIAAREGFKPLTAEQQKTVSDLELKRNNPALSPPEVAAINEQMMSIFRHVGKLDRDVLMRMAEGFSASLLSGIRTVTVQLSPMILTMRDYPIAALSDPKNALSFLTAIYKGHKEAFTRSLKYSWQKDAYGFHLQEIDRQHGALKTWWEDLEKEYDKATNPAKKAWVRTRQLWAAQHYTSRFLNSIDNAAMAGAQPWRLAYYASMAFKEAGLGTAKIDTLITAITRERQAAFDEAIADGADVDAANQRADWKVRQTVSDFVNNATGSETLGAKVVKSAENDLYSMVGRRGQGIKELDEGFLSTPMNHFMEWLSNLRSKGGGPSIWTTGLFGFVNIPFRTARYWAQFGPYGLFRSGVDAYRKSHGLDTFWKQSFGTELQARARLREAIAGTVMMGLATAWGAANSTSDDKAGKENFGLYITGRGPNNRVLQDSWAKEGWKQYSLNFVIGGHKVAIPLTRVGEAVMWPFMLAAAEDDAKWKVKEAKAAGRPAPAPVSNYLGTLVGEYFSMSGQRGIFQGVSQLQELTKGGNTLGKALAKQFGGVASGIILPFKQLLASISDMFVGPLDYSSASSIVANQFPIVGLPFQQRAINRFGDPMYDRSWYGRIQRTGIPIAFQVAKTPENEKLYNDVLLQKGAAPPALLRSALEERYGPLTNSQFAQFAQISGDALKKVTLANADSLKNADPEQVKSFLDKAALQANAQAEAQMQLLRAKPLKRDTAGGGGAPAPSVSTPGLPSNRVLGGSGGGLALSGQGGGSAPQSGGGRAISGSPASGYRAPRSRGGLGRVGTPRIRSGGILRRPKRLVTGRLPKRSGGRIRVSRLGRRRRLSLFR